MSHPWNPLLVGTLLLLPLAVPAIDPAKPGAVKVPSTYVKEDSWAATLLATRAKALTAGKTDEQVVAALWARLDRDFPIPSDWMLQDLGGKRDAWFAAEVPADLSREAIAKVLAELGGVAALQAPLDALVAAKVPGADRRWLDLYVTACEQRRAKRLATLLKQAPHLVYAQHWNMGASHYAYTEGQSDAQAERHFYAGTALLRLDMDGIYGKVKTLVEDANGVIRDPNVSWDGKRILFAWKKSDRQDDYHLYEMDADSGTTRPLTSGLGWADYEGAYLANGDIVFNSTRPVQTVDCWWTEVSNIYTCDKDGRYLRRLGYDQVHTNFPQVMDDGRVTYTRWEYNDRGQLYVQGLFQMNPDGTNQTEFYGNNSWFPTSLLHARAIPGTQKLVAVASGHHSSQAGKLCIVDPSKGRQENEGCTLIAPLRETRAEHIDGYGQSGDQAMYPYALNEREFITTFWPDDGHQGKRGRHDGWFSVFYIDIDGRRELLASDPERSCCQAVPIAARTAPSPRPSSVDYTKTTGSYYMQDVCIGPGLAGVEKGVAKKLRVVSLGYRAAGVRHNGNGGPAGGALVSTPVGGSNTTWDPKTILGDATIHPDGSAFFEVPALTPVYFQVLDAKNRVINTMRSWSTLMPGERFACTGCHENKNAAPPNYKKSQAMAAGVEPLAPFYGPARGFSFRAEVQPILDRNCISCHSDREKSAPGTANARNSAIDLAKAVPLSPMAAEWSFTIEKPAAGWEKAGFDSGAWNKGRAGFGKAGGGMNSPWKTDDIWLRREFTMPAGINPEQLVFNLFHDEDVEIYLNGVLAAKEAGFITDYKQLPLRRDALKALLDGVNLLAVHCHQTIGGQGIEVGLYAGMRSLGSTGPGTKEKVFSLLGTEVVDKSAGRRWTDSYLALTGSRVSAKGPNECKCSALVSWVHPQSTPNVQEPYSCGSNRSGLIEMLDAGHHNVKLNREDLDKIAAWIDLGVPFCSDYVEANCWNDDEVGKYLHFQAKRMRLAEIDRRGIQELLKSQGKTAPVSTPLVRVEFLGADDKGLIHLTNAAKPAELSIPREFRPGERILVIGPRNAQVRIDDLPEMAVATEDGFAVIAVPGSKYAGTAELPAKALEGKAHRVSVRVGGAEVGAR